MCVSPWGGSLIHSLYITPVILSSPLSMLCLITWQGMGKIAPTVECGFKRDCWETVSICKEIHVTRSKSVMIKPYQCQHLHAHLAGNVLEAFLLGHVFLAVFAHQHSPFATTATTAQKPYKSCNFTKTHLSTTESIHLQCSQCQRY